MRQLKTILSGVGTQHFLKLHNEVRAIEPLVITKRETFRIPMGEQVSADTIKVRRAFC